MNSLSHLNDLPTAHVISLSIGSVKDAARWLNVGVKIEKLMNLESSNMIWRDWILIDREVFFFVDLAHLTLVIEVT